jgi:hypothetical protein
MTTLNDFQIQFTKYKWEFLRRNPEYVQEWQQLQNELEEKYEDWESPDVMLRDEEFHFCKKWNIAHPLDPEVSYDVCTKYSLIPDGYDEIQYIDEAPVEGVLSNYGLDLHRLMFHWLNPELFLGVPIRIVDGWSYDHDGDSFYQYVSDKIAENGELTVKIDLNYSKNRLIKEFNILLDEWKILYNDAHKKKRFSEFCKERDIHSFPIERNLIKEFEKVYEKTLRHRKQKYKKKYHFDNFDDYLKVYDLRKKKVSWSNITTKLGLNSIQTARNHYKAACEIIEKGIEFYVK